MLWYRSHAGSANVLKAQETRIGNKQTVVAPSTSRKASLVGILRCRCGVPMSSKAAGKGKKYFYYVCTKRK